MHRFQCRCILAIYVSDADTVSGDDDVSMLNIVAEQHMFLLVAAMLPVVCRSVRAKAHQFGQEFKPL